MLKLPKHISKWLAPGHEVGHFMVLYTMYIRFAIAPYSNYFPPCEVLHLFFQDHYKRIFGYGKKYNELNA